MVDQHPKHSKDREKVSVVPKGAPAIEDLNMDLKSAAQNDLADDLISDKQAV